MSMNVNDLFLSNHLLKNDSKMSGRLLGLCEKIISAGSKFQNSAAKVAKLIFETNILGPIVFCTPEIGKWSTVGGLGVMVDELSLELAKFG
jgi:starch synthase